MRSMVGAALAFILIGACLAAVSAQTVRFPTPVPSRTPTPTPSPTPTPEPKQLPCPAVSIQAAPQQIKEGQPLSFALNLNGGDPRIQPTILWNISSGSIKAGQNSRKIDVDSTGSGQDREIKAGVWVGGFAPECLLEAKAAVKVIPPPAKIGEVGELAPDKVANMLKVLGSTVAQSPDNLYVFVYAGRKSDRGYTFNWLKRMKDELSMAGLDPRRIIAMDGGFREEPGFEFWTVPPGSEAPRPSPTVRRDEIVYPRPNPSVAPVKKPN